MSNLLNKNGKKKLLERGPNIVPKEQFTLDQLDLGSTKKSTKQATNKKAEADQRVSSVRVRKSTQYKLNALVSLNKADTIDELINNMLDEYIDTHITKEQKKQYDMVMELYRLKG